MGGGTSSGPPHYYQKFRKLHIVILDEEDAGVTPGKTEMEVKGPPTGGVQ